MKIEIDIVEVENIVEQYLISSYNELLEDYKNPKNRRIGVFSADIELDQKLIKKRLKAMYKTLDYFCTASQIETVEKVK